MWSPLNVVLSSSWASEEQRLCSVPIALSEIQPSVAANGFHGPVSRRCAPESGVDNKSHYPGVSSTGGRASDKIIPIDRADWMVNPDHLRRNSFNALPLFCERRMSYPRIVILSVVRRRRPKPKDLHLSLTRLAQPKPRGAPSWLRQGGIARTTRQALHHDMSSLPAQERRRCEFLRQLTFQCDLMFANSN